jgi:hypothetical protein
MITEFPVYEGDTAHYNDWFDLTGEWDNVSDGVRCRTFAFKGTPADEVDGAFVEILPGHRTPVQLVNSEHTFNETPFGGKLIIFRVNSGKLLIETFDPNKDIEGENTYSVGKDDLMFWYCLSDQDVVGEVIEHEIPGFSSADLPTITKESDILKGRQIPEVFWKIVEMVDNGEEKKMLELVESLQIINGKPI